MTEFVALTPKTYSYLMDEGSEYKRAKGTKKCVIKREIKSKSYKDCLFNNRIILESQRIFKSEGHIVYTEEINKIVLSSYDDKRLQTFDRITTYPHWANAFKVCKSEMPSKYKWLILMIIQAKIKQKTIQIGHISRSFIQNINGWRFSIRKK